MTDHHHDREVVVTESGSGAGLIVGFLVAAIVAATLIWALAFQNEGDSGPAQVDVTVQQDDGGDSGG